MVLSTRGSFMEWLRKLFCYHKYNQIGFKVVDDDYRNERYSMRRYKCEKCGKEIWVDGRRDYVRG